MEIYIRSSFKVHTTSSLMKEILKGESGKAVPSVLSSLTRPLRESSRKCMELSSSRGYSFTNGLEVISLMIWPLPLLRRRTSEWCWPDHKGLQAGHTFSSMLPGWQKGGSSTLFQLQGQGIPVMEWEDRYRHLGVLPGSNPEACLDKLVAEFGEHRENLFQPSLAN